MPDWSIKIVPAANPTKEAPAAFVPDIEDAEPGDPLKAQDDDIVTWNNTTGDEHWPWPTDANFNPLPDDKVLNTPLYLSDLIPKGRSSRPNYNVLMPGIQGNNIPPTGTIYYCCKCHLQERGTIAVTAVPTISQS